MPSRNEKFARGFILRQPKRLLAAMSLGRRMGNNFYRSKDTCLSGFSETPRETIYLLGNI